MAEIGTHSTIERVETGHSRPKVSVRSVSIPIFSPCSAREVERIAKQHGKVLEERQTDRSGPEPKVESRACQRRAQYCLAIDGVMIAGLPDTDTH